MARLRKAHLAAKNAQVSRFDRVIVGARGFFDSAHKLTVIGLLGFTAIAALATVYTTYDMFTYNRQRRAEFFERQRELDANSLEAARLAYMRGDATEEQIELVEEANERDAAAGQKPRGFFDSMPAVLSEPKTIRVEGAEEEARQEAALAAPGSSGHVKEHPEDKSGSWGSWFGSSSAKSSEAGGKGSVTDSAKAALEKEKENQRAGGPLDRVGLEADAKVETKKKSGWW